MKVLEIPMLMTLLIGFGLVSTIDVPPARADFTFGEPVNIKSIITVIDAAMPDVPDGFSSDGLEMYVRSYRPYGSGSIDLWVSRRTTIASDWGPLENLGPAVNSSKEDSAGCLSRDGLTLYFDSDRSGSYDLYMTTRVANTAPWGPAVSLGPKINSSASGDVCPNISPDGLELYFVSFRSGGYGGADIYVARRASTNDPWGDPTNLGPVVNSTYRETNLKLSADGLLLVFGDLSVSPFRPGGHGGGDMWMTRRASTSSPWQTPVNLGPKVNSPAYDAPLCMSPDGQILYFATLRDGKVDNWQAPILPVVEFNGDGKVDLVDLVMLINDWGKSNSVCDIGPMPWGDGKVDIEDLKVFMTYYEKENPPAQP